MGGIDRLGGAIQQRWGKLFGITEYDNYPGVNLGRYLNGQAGRLATAVFQVWSFQDKPRFGGLDCGDSLIQLLDLGFVHLGGRF